VPRYKGGNRNCRAEMGGEGRGSKGMGGRKKETGVQGREGEQGKGRGKWMKGGKGS